MQLVVYDPYYCAGQMVSYLHELGLETVINRNQDFYADVEANEVPGDVACNGYIPTNQYIAARHTVIDSLTYSIHGCIPFCFQVLVFMLAEHKLATLLTACFFPASSFLCVCCVTCCRVRYSSHQPPLQRRTQTETTAIFSNWCFK